MKHIILKLTLIVFSTFAITSCVNQENKDNLNSVRKVKWIRAENYSNSEKNYIFSGKVESAKDANLAFRVAGVIEHIAGKNGTFVKKGELIACLDDRDYIEQLSATKAEYAATAGEANRIIALYKTKSVTENNYNKAVNGLKQITAKLNIHQNALKDTRLIAPFDGYIQKQHFQEKETIGVGMPIVTFVGTSNLEVVVNIPYRNYAEQDKFKTAVASTHQFPNKEFNLKLIGVSPKANINQLHATRFAIETNNETKMVSGMSVIVKMSYTNKNSASVVLPLSAILEKNNHTYIWILLDDDTVTLKEVKIEEIKRTGNAVISNDIKAGERIITAGVRSLKEGMKVSPMETKSSTNIGNIL